MIQEARQLIMHNMGEKACYLLCMDWIAESLLAQRTDSVESYLHCLEKGWCDSECFMLGPELLLGWRTRKTWKQIRRLDGAVSLPLDTVPQPNWKVLMRYERQFTSETKSHFVVVSPSAGFTVLHDPYGNSDTVANGKPVSLRAFMEVL